jgi:phospho-N-acetylmuramoyl-pentapeptide-transferase
MTIVFLVGGPFIRFIESHKITGPIRDDGPLGHIIKKAGTPTMGGLLILIGILFGTLLWADLNNSYIWVLLMVATSFGLLGAVDDYLKIKHNNSIGISSGMKIIFQILLSIIAVLLLLKFGDNDHLKNLYFPFFKNFILHLGLFFIPF